MRYHVDFYTRDGNRVTHEYENLYDAIDAAEHHREKTGYDAVVRSPKGQWNIPPDYAA